MILVVQHREPQPKPTQNTVRSLSFQFLRAQSIWQIEIVDNGVVSRYPSCSVVLYDAVGNVSAAVECTLWKWEWVAKNCTGKM